MIKLTIDSEKQPITFNNPEWELVENSILKMDGSNVSFCLLELANGDYIQCAGSIEKLTVENREYLDHEFKHFRYGKRKKLSIDKLVWTTINCKVGPIRIHKNEHLRSEDAISIFSDFYYSKDIKDDFRKRNITKDFV